MKTVDWLIKSFIYPFYASHRNIVGVWVIEYLKKTKQRWSLNGKINQRIRGFLFVDIKFKWKIKRSPK